MRMKGLIVLTAVLFASGVWGMDAIEALKGNFASVTVTSTGLTLSSVRPLIRVLQKGIDLNLGDNDEIVLTPDFETVLTDRRHVELILKPALFKNKKKGFWLVTEIRALERGLITTNMHLVLSDTPMKVGEDDVEMVMEKGEWKTVKEYHAIVERENRLQEFWSNYRDKRREAENLFQGEELTNRLGVIEHEARLEKERIESGEQGEPSEEKSKASHFWLYVILFHLILFPTLYFMRKKLVDRKGK